MTHPFLSVTPIYVAVLSLFMIVLAFFVIKLRLRHKVRLLDGGFADLTNAIRAQGNFAEYVPLCLLLMILCELNGVSSGVLHGLGILLLVGRTIHACALINDNLKSRKIGMLMTFSCLILGSGFLLSTLFV